MLAAAWITAVATGLLAVFAVVTAWYVRKAFREQAKELGVLQRQVETTRDMLKVQSDQLGYQQRQFNAQKDLNAKQTTCWSFRPGSWRSPSMSASARPGSSGRRRPVRWQHGSAPSTFRHKGQR